MNHEAVMRRAIALAKKAQYNTDPNPMVGAVLVAADGTTLAEGYHEKAGEPHAEVMALWDFDKAPPDSTLYVTLEPCSHHGKTPPCAELIVRKKVPRVVIGCQDPNPVVAGRGVKILEKNGISVTLGICEQECIKMNRVFNKHITRQLPFVSLKTAATLDGKIAMPTGESKWITGEAARARGHLLRSQHQAIAVGRRTLELDDPQLTDRHSKFPRQPVRIVFSSGGIIPISSQFITDHSTERFVIAGDSITPEALEQLYNAGVKVMVAPSDTPDPKWALQQLYKHGICSVLIEGGAALAASFIKQGLVDQLYLFLSGKIIGSSNAPHWSGELGIDALADVPSVKFQETEKLGDDLLFICEF